MFRQVPVPVDYSRFAHQAVRCATTIARASRGRLDILYVEEELPSGFSIIPLETAEWKVDEKYVQALVNEADEELSLTPSHAVLRGKTAAMICGRAESIDADLIVMTTHGRTGLAREWKGSVTDDVLRHARVPVLMLRPDKSEGALPAPPVIKHILVPLDGSELAAEVLHPASKLARAMGAKLLILRIVAPVPQVGSLSWDPLSEAPQIPDEVATAILVRDAEAQLAGVARLLDEWRISNVDTEIVISGDTARSIIDASHRHASDVVAMSTHGRGASRLFVGSIADAIIRSTKIPLLLQRPVLIGLRESGLESSSVVEQLPALSSG